MSKVGHLHRAMVLAAGLGTRLRPLTDLIPKPLLPVLGRPLLEIILERLAVAGVREVAVNTHHLATQIDAFLARCGGRSGRPPGGRSGGHQGDRRGDPPIGPLVTTFPEPEILGTGGALWNARDFLARDEIFLLHNADVDCGCDLAELAAEHQHHQPLATLLLADWPEVNSVLMAADGAVVDIGGQRSARRGDYPADSPAEPRADPHAGSTVPARADSLRFLTYTGIAVLDRRVLDLLPPGRSSLIDLLLAVIADQPGAVRGFAPPNLAWHDIGTLERYLALHARAVLSGRWPAESITGHGSDRRFWRLAPAGWPAVLMQSPPADEEFDRYVTIAPFLGELGKLADLGALGELGNRGKLGERGQAKQQVEPGEPGARGTPSGLAPCIYHVDVGRRAVVMEDLGADTLFHLVDEALAADQSPAALGAALRPLYRQAIDALLVLQIEGTARLSQCPEAGDRLLGYDTLRWETHYFRRRFLQDYCGLPAARLGCLDQEFHRLAQAVASQPVVLIHRDFQSQNILFKNGKVRLVDFQGLRRGPLLYDLMSLLRDAYVDLVPELRVDLLAYYADQLAERGGPSLTADHLRLLAITAGLQRNMQALGAFGFLSLVKGKDYFRRFMPLGLRHLVEGLAELAGLAERAEPAELTPPAEDPGAGPAVHPGPLPRLSEIVADVTTGTGPAAGFSLE